MMFDDSLSDDDEYAVAAIIPAVIERNKRHKHGGSMQGHDVVSLNKQQGHDKLWKDYFADEPMYGPATFKRRFRMSKICFYALQLPWKHIIDNFSTEGMQLEILVTVV